MTEKQQLGSSSVVEDIIFYIDKVNKWLCGSKCMYTE